MKIALIELGNLNGELYPDVTMGWHNHGLAMLATILKKENIEFDYINLKELSHFNLLIDKLSIGYDLVAISIMSSDYQQAAELIDGIKRNWPKTKIVVGGIATTVSPQGFIDNPDVDFIIQGEGEISFLRFSKGTGLHKL
jgi:radical SAM superfamily enzyme YgiQ (UPF0313 family)